MQMRAQHQYQHHENTIDRSHLKRAYSSLCSDSGPSVDPASELDSSKRKKQQQQHFPDLSLEIPNKLTRSDFEHAKVLGQVDKKYIAIKLLHNNNLIMIDQHAADERIKLEVMLKNITSIAMLEPPITIDLDSASEFQLVTSERISKYLKIWGIHITTTMMNRVINRHTEQEEAILSQSRYFNTEETSSHFENDSSKNRVYVTRLPNLIVDRCIVNHDLLKALIRDHVYWMAEQKEESALIKTCPKGIMEMLKSKACRSTLIINMIACS
jgi:DNA mismatch repair protein MLH3